MNIEYTEIDSMENIAEHAVSNIKINEACFNSILAYEFSVDTLRKEISDVTDEALMWANESCPNELYINHGSYVKDGLNHIISELKEKPSSNRALFSLISQEDISGSGDDPIPSFMIFQTCIDGNTLYCTVYFRALEISTFLRVNSEEIRLKLLDIYNQLLSFEKVKLVIFAFRGYNNPKISALKKAKIDLLTPIQIYKKLEDNPGEFNDLIKEKAKDSTVICLKSLNDLDESLRAIKTDKIRNIDYIKALVSKAIATGEQLQDIRKKHSHHDSVEQIKIEYSAILNRLAEEF